MKKLLKELQEIKKLLQIIVSNQEQVTNQTNEFLLDGQALGELFCKNDPTKMPDSRV